MMTSISHLLLVLLFVTQSRQYENLALRKKVTVSSRYNATYFNPNLVVDGDDSTDLSMCTLTASGQKEAWLTVDLGDVKNIASVSFLHGGLGLHGTKFILKDNGRFLESSGNGTLQIGSKTVCSSWFHPEAAKVVCLNYGYLPDNSTQYVVPVDEGTRFSGLSYNCKGTEVRLGDCDSYVKSFFGNCPSEKGVFLSCKSGDTLAGISVYVSDTPDLESGILCHRHVINKPVQNNVSIECITTGRYVTFYNSRNETSPEMYSNFAYINLCEVYVKGCNHGFYGQNCSECPNHCLNNTCDILNGDCVQCIDGYTGTKCETECNAGQYGSGCSLSCGSCQRQEACEHINGSCPSGCSPGWKGDNCDQSCDQGYFGLGCNSTCYNKNCVNSNICEPIQGQCKTGCIKGWTGPFCEECAQHFYGEKCNDSCSELCESKLCNKTTGYCYSCIGTRNSDICERENLQIFQTVSAEGLSGAVIGSIVAVCFIMFLALLLVCVIVRRKRHLDPEVTVDQATTDIPMSERIANMSLQKEINHDTTEEISNVINDVSYIAKTPDQIYLDNEETESEAKTEKGSLSEKTNDVGIEVENLENILVPKLHEYILRNHRNQDKGFRAEFNALPEADISRCTIGGQEKNTLRNRYRNTLPYDYSRVVLTDPGGEDYINANYIHNIQGDKTYIACQGPKRTTVNDFWRMIWQEEVRSVVMLTRTVEGEKKKCEQYWPAQGKTVISNKIEITTEQEEEFAFYTVRQLKVMNYQGNKADTRYVHHFHFTGWPDHSVPPTSQLLLFYFRVREKLDSELDKSPLVVHCSAGVGRTGTFIALDALVQNGVKTGTVNVKRYVNKMRRERMYMIQTMHQYMTVYKCLDEFFNYPRHVVFKEAFTIQTASKNVLCEEFQEIQTFLKKQREYEACIPKTESQGDPNSFIIAEYPTLFLEDGFIVSRHPLSNELHQFLPIISDVDPSIVIVLDADQSTTQGWIPEEKSFIVGRYVVKKKTSGIMTKNKRMSTTRIEIKNGDGEEKDFQIIEPVANQDSDYSNVTNISDILDAFTSLDFKKNDPIFILNNDNNAEVLTLVTVVNALQQLCYDGETDICFLARHLQIIQDTEPLTLDDYVEGYRLVKKYVSRPSSLA